jgi:deazaflavin-dependent oxidoreductase (nitroreductase family)
MPAAAAGSSVRAMMWAPTGGWHRSVFEVPLTQEEVRLPEPDDDNRQVIEEFRAQGGVVGGRLAGTPLLLLTVTGAQTSRPRTVPVAFVDDGDRVLVAAWNLGFPKLPDWYYSLVVHPDVSVEVGDETYGATALVLRDDDRELGFARCVERFPFLHEAQQELDHEIPVVALVRQS